MLQALEPPADAALLQGVAQIGVVPTVELAVASAELTASDPGFAPGYVGFNDGGWHSAVLWNPSGSADDRILADGDGRPTAVAGRFPATTRLLQRLVEGHGMRVSWARLARLTTAARVWEHRDFLELAHPDKVRLHVPIVTNPAAFLQFSRAAVHLACGWLWHLDGAVIHGASNDGPARIHLIVDCQRTPVLEERLRARALDPAWVVAKPPFTAADFAALSATFHRLADAGDLGAAERKALEVFLSYDLGASNTFRLAAELCRKRGRFDRAAHWENEERDKLVRRTPAAVR